MNMKLMGWGVEILEPAVCSNGVQTCTGLQTKPFPIAPYSDVMEDKRIFPSIFGHGADVALMQGAHEHEAKGMRS